ncbi:hypothetical protein [Corynebacterium renale]|uniref:Uncharacterized protein n=1 Tax=Corynebacterium renale TaxID=1724 RepID=A0A2A9DP96_9CORY|nr:hypothetical protein [Corynebacterium renale]PFG27739.1 hypothetical protein ATK06_0815 [Corynebacterium renale]SQI22158.1 Uncharacterised protein [Corynebacterium renale]
MKRFIAGVLAVATACSLSTGVANAKTSSEIDEPYMQSYLIAKRISEWLEPGSGFTSSTREHGMSQEITTEDLKAMGSSYKNDVANNYRIGTTQDILIGTGIAATVLAAIAAAIQSGAVKLPF